MRYLVSTALPSPLALSRKRERETIGLACSLSRRLPLPQAGGGNDWIGLLPLPLAGEGWGEGRPVRHLACIPSADEGQS